MMSKNEDYPLVQAFINALNAKSQGEVEKTGRDYVRPSVPKPL